MSKSIQIAVDIPNGAKAQNAKWLTNDYYVEDLGKFRCNFVLNTDARIEYTLTGGAVDPDDWFLINDGNDFKAQRSYGHDIYVRAGDLLNFRTPDTGVIVRLGRCDSIKDEG